MAIVKTDAQHYADIAAAIRTKSGGTARYKPREMSGAILGLASGGQESAILVYAPTGSQVTLSCGDTVRTVTEKDGLWRFDNCALGIWTVTAHKDGMSSVYSVEIQEQGQLMRYEVHVVYAKIYGICRDITSSSPVWTRTDEAVGMTATASVGTVAGHSDFNQAYPWSGICRETLSTGDVMVKIPRFWYRRYREGNMEYIKIADCATDGYKLHPAFCHGGVMRDRIYVAAHKSNVNHMSAPTGTPRTNDTIAEARGYARSKGAGWELLDISTFSAIQMLYLVEFATFDSQKAVGYGYAKASAANSKIDNGTTGSVPNLTGVPAGTTGLVDVVWRGIEGIWGNVFQYIDGALSVDGYYRICNDPSKYGDSANSAYSSMNFKMPVIGSSHQYITKLCLQEGDLDYVMLPQEAGSGSSSTYICDTTSSGASGTRVMKQGGRWYSNDYVGLFMCDFATTPASTYGYNGTRIMYIPQEVSA